MQLWQESIFELQYTFMPGQHMHAVTRRSIKFQAPCMGKFYTTSIVSTVLSIDCCDKLKVLIEIFVHCKLYPRNNGRIEVTETAR